jgi:hypothetical protein
MSFKTIDSSCQKVMMMDFVDLYDKLTSRKRSMIAMQQVSETQKEQSTLKNQQKLEQIRQWSLQY